MSLTRPAPSLEVATIFILDVQIPRLDFVMDPVAAVYLDMRVHNGHKLCMNQKKNKERELTFYIYIPLPSSGIAVCFDNCTIL